MTRRPRRNHTGTCKAKVALDAIKGEKTLSELAEQHDVRDNVFVERVWKSIKYEEVYLHAYDSVHQARTSIGKYIEFYNSIRPHSSLQALTPDPVYLNRLPESLAA